MFDELYVRAVRAAEQMVAEGRHEQARCMMCRWFDWADRVERVRFQVA